MTHIAQSVQVRPAKTVQLDEYAMKNHELKGTQRNISEIFLLYSVNFTILYIYGLALADFTHKNEQKNSIVP